MRFFHNGQDLIAAQITKLYKFDRERGRGGEDIRNRSLGGGHAIDGRMFPFGFVSEDFTRLERDD